MTADLKKLIAECRRWNVKVSFCNKLPIDQKKNVFHAPFCDGIACSVHDRKIFIEKKREAEPFVPSQALHELAHILLGKRPDDAGDEVDNGMLGVEFYTAKHRKFKHWERSMASYQIGDGGRHSDWKKAGYRVRRKAIAASTREAKRLGLLDQKCQPTYKMSCLAARSS
jgi:hypothetical protein